MKLICGSIFRRDAGSLPSRERGLKQTIQKEKNEADAVAPFAGAWIETVLASSPKSSARVAPFAGAWIETVNGPSSGTEKCSRSLRGSVD